MLAKTESGQESIAVDSLADLTAVVDELRAELHQERQRRKEAEAERDELRAELEDLREEVARERAEDRKRITELEDDVEDLSAGDNTQGSTGEDTPADTQERPQTPLEQTAGLPQDMIDRETANVRRAVFVAQDVMDYSRKVPAGRVIRTSELRKVLKAGTDSNGHRETVSRVMSVLNDLGGDDIRIVERRGERRVVFSEAIAERLDSLGDVDPGERQDVVTPGTV